jgi:hypothetical protein
MPGPTASATSAPGEASEAIPEGDARVLAGALLVNLALFLPLAAGPGAAAALDPADLCQAVHENALRVHGQSHVSSWTNRLSAHSQFCFIVLRLGR